MINWLYSVLVYAILLVLTVLITNRQIKKYEKH